jgi:hypothetical protein
LYVPGAVDDGVGDDARAVVGEHNPAVLAQALDLRKEGICVRI